MLHCEVCGKEIDDEEAISCIDNNGKKIYICEDCAE